MGFSNATPFSALDVPWIDPAGREVVIIVVKGTFQVLDDGRVARCEEQAPIRLNDVPYDPDNIRGSLRYPTDVCPEKWGADVVVVGDAVARAKATSVDVAIKVSESMVPLLVHGERFFYKSLVNVLISPAAPFERKPIVYERAYGGASADWMVIEHRNPAGVGVAKDALDLVDTLAPQIEHPGRPHRSADDHHPPVGAGAIMSHWSPRKELAGTFDEAWKETRMPLMPEDFDVRFNNVAHPSLILPSPLAGGEPVAILGMTLEGLFRFEVPRLPVAIRARFDQSGSAVVRPLADTLIVEPERRRFELVARKALPIGRGRDVLREVVADLDRDAIKGAGGAQI
jgi:hypothetical protein